MRIAYVVSDLTYPPREGLHEQTLRTALIHKNRGDVIHLFGFCRDLKLLDEQRMTTETGLAFQSRPIPTRIPNLPSAFINHFIPLMFRSARIRHLFLQITHAYDVIHFENIASCGLVRQSISDRSVLGIIDPGSLRWARFSKLPGSITSRSIAAIQSLLHSVLETSLGYPGVAVHFVSPDDAAYFHTRHPLTNAISIPVAVEMDLFTNRKLDYVLKGSARAAVPIDLRQPHLREGLRRFITSVIRPLNDSGITIELRVLGRIEPDESLRALCIGLPVSFLTWTSDFSKFLTSADIVIVPDLSGTGIKNRVVQALALACPVVGTRIAFEGISAVNGTHAIISDQIGDLANGIKLLLEDEETRIKIANAGHILARRDFGIESLQSRWQEFYAGVLARSRETRSQSNTPVLNNRAF